MALLIAGPAGPVSLTADTCPLHGSSFSSINTSHFLHTSDGVIFGAAKGYTRVLPFHLGSKIRLALSPWQGAATVFFWEYLEEKGRDETIWGGFGDEKFAPLRPGVFDDGRYGRRAKMMCCGAALFVSLDIVIPRYPMIETLLSAGPLRVGCFWRLMARSGISFW